MGHMQAHNVKLHKLLVMDTPQGLLPELLHGRQLVLERGHGDELHGHSQSLRNAAQALRLSHPHLAPISTGTVLRCVALGMPFGSESFIFPGEVFGNLFRVETQCMVHRFTASFLSSDPAVANSDTDREMYHKRNFIEGETPLSTLRDRSYEQWPTRRWVKVSVCLRK